MKATLKTLLLVVLLGLGSTGKSQTVAIVDYMKVPPGGDGEYRELENEWKKIHKARVDQGMILNWQLYQKKFASEGDDYQYITVTFYEDFKHTENPFPWEWIQENYTDAEQSAMMKRTGKARKLVKTEVYENLAEAWGDNPSRYLILERWKAKPGKYWDYIQFEKEDVQPVFKEMVENGGILAGWSAWTREFGEGDWDVVTVNGYTEYAAWRNRWSALEPILRKLVDEENSWEDIMALPGELRYEVGTKEIWEAVDYVGPEED